MPMGRRIINRKEMRADFDAAERKKQDDEETDEAEDEAEDEEEEDEGEEEAESGEEEPADEGEADEDEEAPKKKKKKAKAPPKPAKAAKPPRKTRTRTPKVVRMKVVWGVFNNSNARVATFDYPKRKEADDLATKLTADKKNTHFVQPIKEPIEEKKEA
jgi:cobalamin biosynthesis protein CobT